MKQVDSDGTFSYSPVVFVEGLAGKVLVYPNPNNGTFVVICGTQTTAESGTRLFNAQGVEVPFAMEGNKITLSPSGQGDFSYGYILLAYHSGRQDESSD